MKCPLCGKKMFLIFGTKHYHCENVKCSMFEASSTAKSIRAIRRKLKAEYNRGFDVGLFAGKKSRGGNP